METESKQHSDLLHDSCERNIAVELHRQTTAGGLITYRGRLLRELDEPRLIEIEMPKSEWGAKGLEPGHVLTAYLVLENGVHSFLCDVREIKRGLELNQSMLVEGVVVHRLGEIKTSQRRNAYRIQLVGSTDIAVSIHSATDRAPFASPLDSWRFSGHIIESSATGLGVVVDQKLADVVRAGEFAFITFAATGQQESFCFLVEVRHVQGMFEGEKSRLGMKIQRWPDRTHFGKEIFRFERLINDVERARRRRMAG